MIGKFKNGQIIKCEKCKSQHFDEIDHNFDLESEEIITITFDLECNECGHILQIVDVFEYQYSKRN